jgi:hypothetical protein
MSQVVVQRLREIADQLENGSLKASYFEDRSHTVFGEDGAGSQINEIRLEVNPAAS